MDALEIPYLLKRARAHRRLSQIAKSGEARLIHRQFVNSYQALLVAIRRRCSSPGTCFRTVKKQRVGLVDGIAAMTTDGKVA
jgi:hypothetical protein